MRNLFEGAAANMRDIGRVESDGVHRVGEVRIAPISTMIPPAEAQDRATWNAALVLRTQGPAAAADVLAMYDRLLTNAYGEQVPA